MGQDVSLFTEVDKTGDADFFIRFLDQGNALPDIQRSKPIILDGLRLRDGLSVLDVGCGAGTMWSI
jgi:cyclopropane fatty-acyl-phospholipid synthase-like methyltransferase